MIDMKSDCAQCNGTRVIECVGKWERENVCPACSSAQIKGIRTNCLTGKESEKHVRVVVRFAASSLGDGLGRWIFEIVGGGVTGHEGWYVEDYFSKPLDRDWWACAGTPGRWDGLRIPLDQMKLALQKMQLWKE